VDGIDVVADPAGARQRLGFCTGTTGIYERMTPREMIRYFGSLYGLDEETLERRIEELFDLFDMRSFADTANGRLSAGMRQKVSLARTIVHDPPVLVFDEPTVSLDVLVARTVTEFVAECAERERTVILSSHIMAEVEKLCDDVAILHRGKILDQGTVEEVKGRNATDSLEELFFSLIDRCDAESSS
jgi:sodium transport system ATP-binding protein